MAPKVQGSAKFTMPTQLKRYSRPLVMQSTSPPRTWRGGSDSTKYTNIQSEYAGNLTKIKFLEARIMDYDMRDPFIIPTLVDE